MKQTIKKKTLNSMNRVTKRVESSSSLQITQVKVLKSVDKRSIDDLPWYRPWYDLRSLYLCLFRVKDGISLLGGLGDCKVKPIDLPFLLFRVLSFPVHRRFHLSPHSVTLSSRSPLYRRS